MAILTFEELLVFTRDFLSERRLPLEDTLTGELFLPLFEVRLREMEALPQARAAQPYARELQTADALHDGIGAAIWHMTEAYARNPEVDDDLRQAAQRVQKAVVPSPGDLARPYAAEVANTTALRRQFRSLEPFLERFPVPGGRLTDWVTSFLIQGEKIEALLARQASELVEPTDRDRAEAAHLRNTVTALIGRARATISDELESNANLPRDLDQQVFGYYDELLRLHMALLRRAGETNKAG